MVAHRLHNRKRPVQSSNTAKSAARLLHRGGGWEDRGLS